MVAGDIGALLGTLQDHETRARRSFNFTPSENTLSPLARLPFVLDGYSRYFFDHMELFGEWMFFGGIEAGQLEPQLLKPMLSEMAAATHVDVRPISGLNCMTVAMAGLCPAGGTMYTVPVESGGHMSTTTVAGRLGIRTVPIPMAGHHAIDLDALADLLVADPPDLVYLDQSTQLFPLDPLPVRSLLDRHAPDALLHYDSSHVNGLILGGAIENPLLRGADTFGGSTHKTLPGPHKAFLATNDARAAELTDEIAYHFISHRQSAGIISLAITLLELRDCGGAIYAKQVMENALVFARTLHEAGVPVAAADEGFTACHQVWAGPAEGVSAATAGDRMFDQGLLVNRLGGLPGIDGTGFRFSLSELTRLGADASDAAEMADVFATLLTDRRGVADVSDRVASLRSRLSQPRYCFTRDELEDRGAPSELLELFTVIERLVRAR